MSTLRVSVGLTLHHHCDEIVSTARGPRGGRTGRSPLRNVVAEDADSCASTSASDVSREKGEMSPAISPANRGLFTCPRLGRVRAMCVCAQQGCFMNVDPGPGSDHRGSAV